MRKWSDIYYIEERFFMCNTCMGEGKIPNDYKGNTGDHVPSMMYCPECAGFGNIYSASLKRKNITGSHDSSYLRGGDK